MLWNLLAAAHSDVGSIGGGAGLPPPPFGQEVHMAPKFFFSEVLGYTFGIITGPPNKYAPPFFIHPTPLAAHLSLAIPYHCLSWQVTLRL